MPTISHAPRHRTSTSTLGRVGRPVAALGAASALMLGLGVPAQASTVAVADERAPLATAASAPAGTAPGVGGAASHTVEPGDTLNAIAATYGTTLDSVLAQNGLSVNSIIYPGDTITVPGPGNSATEVPAPALAPVPAASASDSAAASPTGSTVTLASAGVTESPATSANAAILASAQSQLGAGQNCTVLGEQALKAAGVGGVGDESPAGLMESATPVAVPQPGDFIYYEDGGAGVPHNAVYIGDGEAIHSGFNGGQTVVNSADVGSGPSYYRVNA